MVNGLEFDIFLHTSYFCLGFDVERKIQRGERLFNWQDVEVEMREGKLYALNI